MACPALTHFSSSKGYCVLVADSDCSSTVNIVTTRLVNTATTTLQTTTKTSESSEFLR